MHITFIVIIISGLLLPLSLNAQKKDTLRKYLDENLMLTSRKKMVYPAVAVKGKDHWLLFAVYPDTSKLLSMYFSDEELTIRDGPFTLNYPRNIKAIEGRYSKNSPNGSWRYWHRNGQLKDSGMLVHNHKAGAWYSWDENGRLLHISNYKGADSIIASTNFINKKISVKNSSLVSDENPTGNRNGLWRRYHSNGQLADSGLFRNELRNGPWTSWYPNGQLESSGWFSDGNLTGQWQYYRENGSMATKETYTNNRVSALECYDEGGNFTGLSCSILKPPVPLGDFVNFNEYMLDNIFWPKSLLNRHVQGNVVLQCSVSKEGELVNLKIVESPHELLSKEAERFFRSIKKWSPAISHNRPVEFTAEFIVPFLKSPY